MLSDVLAQVDRDAEGMVKRLGEFLQIPSVSAQPEGAADVRRCADFLASELQHLGFTAKVLPTGGHPVVLGQSPQLPGRPTVLFYGHYDVQPVEPLELWQSPPFTPTIRNGAIYARGAADDKGQVWAHVEAIRAWGKGLPVNLILLIEGEEEIGSENLAKFIAANREQLRGDVALISDTNQFARGVPAITYGLRGLVYEEVFLEGPSDDLNSGFSAGRCPIRRMCCASCWLVCMMPPAG